MYDVDLAKFWREDEIAHEDNCFSPRAKQAALGIRMHEECVYAELGLPDAAQKMWSNAVPDDERIENNKRYNDKAEAIVGKRLLPESFDRPLPRRIFPAVKGFYDVFEAKNMLVHGSWWLERNCFCYYDLDRLLDRVDARLCNLRAFLLPDNWLAEKTRIYEKYGIMPNISGHHIRGPVTFAASIMGVEDMVFMMYDEPDLAKRLSEAIAGVLIAMNDIFDEESGTLGARGFSFADDNCCLLNPEAYEMFGYPVLKRVFDHFSPDPLDNRYQHSDSAMGHLLPILAKCNLIGCNFGPTVAVKDIRAHMPKTRIDGQLAPFTFMNNDESGIIEQVKRDCDAARTTKGLNIFTAGSINNGSKLTSLRCVMYAIQEFGQY